MRSKSFMPARVASAGQVLVLFVLFLLVLLGVSAVGIDYASWLLTDRSLQNTADHAALAGASQFQDRTTATNCAGNKCYDARRQAWTSLNDELDLGLLPGQIDNLALANTVDAGVTGVTAAMKDRFWVSSPPPSYAAYPGLYDGNHGVVFVRVDRAVTSFLGGALGIQPQARTGWATAGALPTDFALQIFCRNHISPQSGVCENSAGLTIDGQGGVTLVKGDVGSNESLTVTSNVGAGVVMMDGNVFLVNRTCHNSTWRCPNGPPSRGGISDGSGNGKNAFHIAPLPVPRYESPSDIASTSNCAGASATSPCIPFQSQYGSVPAGSPGDWACNDGITACGTPNMASVPPTCGAGAFNPGSRFLRPNTDDSNAGNRWDGTPLTTNIYRNIDDAGVDPAGSLPGSNPGSAVLAGAPTDWVASEDNRAVLYRVALSPPQGTPGGTDLTVRYVAFRTASQVLSAAGGATVPLEVRLVQKVGSSYDLRGAEQTHNLDQNVTVYQYQVPFSAMTGSAWYNSLYLEFEVPAAVAARGAGVSWAEAEISSLSQPLPPTIKPGYWKSITIPAGGCALMDPAPSSGLLQYQLPGVYRFGGTGTGASAPRIVLGNGAMLIGDGVTTLFDPRSGSSGFPDNGIDIDRNGALVINTGTTTSNPSAPLTALPADAISAAWRVDNADTTNPRNGEISWPVCLTGGNDCVPRSCYMNTNSAQCGGQTVTTLQFGRGITFYLTPDWSSPDIQRRFYMGGNGNADAPGVLFKAVLYAPYDDVKITGRNNFNTVGQVMAWTAKFNGGSASLFLDYPYDYTPASPYLLEPTVDH
jgi:hypothetical protein